MFSYNSRSTFYVTIIYGGYTCKGERLLFMEISKICHHGNDPGLISTLILRAHHTKHSKSNNKSFLKTIVIRNWDNYQKNTVKAGFIVGIIIS